MIWFIILLVMIAAWRSEWLLASVKASNRARSGTSPINMLLMNLANELLGFCQSFQFADVYQL